jgi:hypothetical protein
MPAFIAAAGMAATGMMTFSGAKVGSIIISACVPIITMELTYSLSGKRFNAFLASALSVFPVFYSSLITTTDSFPIMMILGGLLILAAQKRQNRINSFLIGLIAGLIHLTRADGLIWLGAGILIVLFKKNRPMVNIVVVLSGYLLVMVPWFARNYLALGEIMPSGTIKMLWLTEYNELFNYQAETLSFRHWIQQGLTGIMNDIFEALMVNLRTSFLVQGQIILAPLIAVGFWRHKKDVSVSCGFITYLFTFLIMTVVFPFAGRRGAFLHSGAAFQPLLWALGSSGFQVMMEYGVNKRAWQIDKANRLFGVSLVVLISIATGFVYWERVIGDAIRDPLWNRSFQEAVYIGEELKQRGGSEGSLIMINNPPGLYIATGLSSIAIPNGGVDSLIQAGIDFEADFIVIEENHPGGLNDLYKNPGKEQRLEHLGTVNGTHYFSFR